MAHMMKTMEEAVPSRMASLETWGATIESKIETASRRQSLEGRDSGPAAKR